MDLKELLDRLAARAEEKDFGQPPDEWAGEADPQAGRLIAALTDRNLRAEHRQRIHQDFVSHREMFLDLSAERLVDLAVWSEHVESLYKSLKKGSLQTFHYVRALEATCRRCGFELLPLMAQVEDLGHAWGGRDLKKTWEIVSPHFEQADAPGEAT